MDQMQFVACSETGCSFNTTRSCHAYAIDITKEGFCSTKNVSGPKHDIATYVHIRECASSKCQYWKLDESSGLGQCAYNAELFFMVDKPNQNPVCHEFHKQAQRV